MSIKGKSLSLFAVIFVSFFCLQLYQFYTASEQGKKLREMEERTLKAALLSEEMKLAVVQVQQWLTDISATRAQDGLNDGFALAEQYAQQFYANLAELQSLMPEEADALNEMSQSFAAYYEMGQKMANDYISFGTAKGNETMGAFDQASEDINQRIDEVRDKNVAQINQAMQEVESINQQNFRVTVVFFVIVLAVSLVAVFFYIRSLIRPLHQLEQSTIKIAEGDLSEEVVSASKDEIGELARSFETMRLKLAQLIEQIQNTGLQVAATSEELAASVGEVTQASARMSELMHNVASGAETQVQGAEESARAMEEMAVGIQRIAESSAEVSEFSAETVQQASVGNESIQQAVNKIDKVSELVEHSAAVVAKLGERSREIDQIIEVIKEITDQTNLLALNAAIEASRAGEQGRGFAVVADEVRKLAEQSKRSAVSITEMIRKVQEDTEEAIRSIAAGQMEAEAGKTMMREAGQLFRRILRDSEKIAGEIQEISAATEQMSAGSQQITASILELNSIAKNALEKSREVSTFSEEQLQAMESISSSAAFLERLAHDLERSVQAFQTAKK